MDLSLPLEAFGEPLVSYAINVPTLDESRFTETQKSILEILTQASIEVLRQDSPTQRNFTRRQFIARTFEGPQDHGIISQSRSMCGSPPPTFDEPDPVKRDLYRLVYELYPLTLVRHEAVFGLSSSWDRYQASSVLAFKAGDSLARHALADSDLAKLYPGDWHDKMSRNNLYEVTSNMTWISGSSRSEQLIALPDALASFTFQSGAIAGANDFWDYLPHASRAVDLARRLANGQAVAIPLVVGFTNISFEPGVTILLDEGRARSAEERTSSIAGGYSGTSSATVVVALEVSERLLEVVEGVSNDRAFEKRLELMGARAEAAWRAVNIASYAFILASRENEIFAPQVDGYVELNPISSGATQRHTYRYPSTFPPRSLDTRDARRVEMRFREIKARHPDSLNVTMKRLVSAVSQRNDALDAFVDAVLCWENMFSGAPETNFKVCASIALLLEPNDPSRRAALFKRLKKLYTARSTLVHGGKEASLEEATRMKDETVWIAIQTVQSVYSRDDLVDCKSADERHQRLILGI
jgi:hypothetical protein